MLGIQLDRRFFSLVDYPLLFITLAISLIGVFAIYSSTYHTDNFLKGLYLKQLMWVGAGFIAMLMTIMIDMRELARFAYLLYALALGSLIYVAFFGKVIYGAQRWIDLGFFSFQASEFAKIALLLSLAKFFDDGKEEHRMKDLIVPIILTLIIFLLVAKEPDLGTALMILVGFVVAVLLTEVHRSIIWNVLKAGVILLPCSWFFLKEYQKNRIYTLLDPSIDPLGTGYHTIQSKIAIGSGGIWGKGLYGGTQSRLNFLPERHTDFIFSVICEHSGLIGATVVLILFLALLVRCFMITASSRDRFSAVLCGSLSGALSGYILFNIGMAIGLFPVVGIPLPLVSYGGSSILFTFITIGMIISTKAHRFRTA